MAKHNVTVFSPYDFSPGQKIRIEGGPRAGDWEVIGVDDAMVKLRCPVSRREFEWRRFCYCVEQLEDAEWPRDD